MLMLMFSAACRTVSEWLLYTYGIIFPEYPKIGFAIFIAAAIFLAYFSVKGEFKVAFKMCFSTIIFFSVVFFFLHWLLKVFRVAI